MLSVLLAVIQPMVGPNGPVSDATVRPMRPSLRSPFSSLFDVFNPMPSSLPEDNLSRNPWGPAQFVTATHRVVVCDLGDREAGCLVTATIDTSGEMPNIRLIEDKWMNAYRDGSSFESHGGRASGPSYSVVVPFDGHWHVVADLIGVDKDSASGGVSFLVSADTSS